MPSWFSSILLVSSPTIKKILEGIGGEERERRGIIVNLWRSGEGLKKGGKRSGLGERSERTEEDAKYNIIFDGIWN